MKTIIATIAAVITLASAGTIYPQTYIVTDVDYTADVVEITSATGYTYEFTGTEDWIEGDLCSCIMYNSGTEDITDDVILATRYSGTCEMLEAWAD